MASADIVIARATLADVDGILQLERANQIKNGGTLSSSGAHAKMPIREVAEFTCGGSDYLVFAYKPCGECAPVAEKSEDHAERLYFFDPEHAVILMGRSPLRCGSE